MKKVLITIAIMLLFVGILSNPIVSASEKDNSFFGKETVLRHAMGGMYDNEKTKSNPMIYNNTVEALENSIKKGYKLIELDLILTKDNELVCSHGWSEQTYKDTGIYDKYDAKNPVMTRNNS